MPEKPYKRAERQVARRLGGKRSPAGEREKADVTTPWLSVEVKLRSRLPQWITGAVASAVVKASPRQLGIAVLKTPRRGEAFVVMLLTDFEEWWGKIEKDREERE